MLPATERKTTQERFADLFRSVEQSETYHLEGAKVEISEQIYLAMEQQGISKAELARRLGKSRAYITKVLQGNTNFTLESLVRIARALGHKFDFHLMAERAAESSLDLAEPWPKSLRLKAGARRAMQHKHAYKHMRLVNPSPKALRESEHATVSVAA